MLAIAPQILGHTLAVEATELALGTWTVDFLVRAIVTVLDSVAALLRRDAHATDALEVRGLAWAEGFVLAVGTVLNVIATAEASDATPVFAREFVRTARYDSGASQLVRAVVAVCSVVAGLAEIYADRALVAGEHGGGAVTIFLVRVIHAVSRSIAFLFIRHTSHTITNEVPWRTIAAFFVISFRAVSVTVAPLYFTHINIVGTCTAELVISATTLIRLRARDRGGGRRDAVLLVGFVEAVVPAVAAPHAPSRGAAPLPGGAGRGGGHCRPVVLEAEELRVDGDASQAARAKGLADPALQGAALVAEALVVDVHRHLHVVRRRPLHVRDEERLVARHRPQDDLEGVSDLGGQVAEVGALLVAVLDPPGQVDLELHAVDDLLDAGAFDGRTDIIVFIVRAAAPEAPPTLPLRQRRLRTGDLLVGRSHGRHLGLAADSGHAHCLLIEGQVLVQLRGVGEGEGGQE